MRQTLQFLALMACGVLIATAGLMVMHATTDGGMPRPGARSAAGIDYMSFGVGLALGLTLSEIARLSWSDMPRRAVGWLIANQHNFKYCAYAAVSIAILFYV